MLRRPKPGEDDLEAMMEQFDKDKNMQIAAQVVKKRKPPDETEDKPKKPKSVFARRRQEQSGGLENESPETPAVQIPVLADIVERDIVTLPSLPSLSASQNGFPQVLKLDDITKNSSTTNGQDGDNRPSKRTLFSQQFQKMKQELSKDVSRINENMSSGSQQSSMQENKSMVENLNGILGDKSFILDGTGLKSNQEAQELHNENINKLQIMSETEILEEQQKLFKSLDPKLIEFLTKRRSKQFADALKMDVDQHDNCENLPQISKNNREVRKEDIKVKEHVDESVPMAAAPESENKIELASVEKVVEELVDKYPNMNKDEPEKREWMADVPVKEPSVGSVEAGFSARFGFDGILLDHKEQPDVGSGLYHHGEEADRPGYTLLELFTLIRSSNSQQRVVALNTLSAILEKYWTGIYDSCFGVNLLSELIECGLVSLLRSCMDEKEESLIYSGTECLANLIAPQGEESGLDLIMVYSLESPALAPTIDAEVREQEIDLKDHELVQIDVIAGLLRMDILQRIKYILTVLKPGPGVVLASLRILTRIARHSAPVAQLILDSPGLVAAVVTHFLPALVPAQYPKTSLYGLPVHLACKLCRVIAGWNSKHAKRIVTEHRIERSLMVYLTIDPSEAAIPPRESILLCIESFRTWSLLLKYNVSLETYNDIYPVIMRLLLYFVNNINITESADKNMLDCDVGAWLLTVLTTVLGSGLPWNEVSGLYAPVDTCARKWLIQVSRMTSGITNSARSMIAASLAFISMFLTKIKGKDDSLVENWKKESGPGLKDALNTFMNSEYYNQLITDMQNKSVYLQPVFKEDRTVSALPLPGAVLKDGVVHPILHPSSPVHLTTQLFRLISITASMGLTLWPADKLVAKLNPVFLKSLTYSKLSVISNWFSKFEARCLFWLLMACKDSTSFGTQLLALSIRVCGLIHSPDDILVQDLLELIVFNKSFLKSEDLLAQYMSRVGVHNVQPLSSASNIGTVETSLVNSIEKSIENIEDIKKMYLEKLLKDAHCRHSLAIHSCDNSGVQVMTFSCETVLSQDWQYFPLLETYSMEQNNKKTDNECLPAVRNCLSWLLIANTSTEQSSKADVTAEYCRLATVFLAGNDFFLDPEVHVLLSTMLNEILSVGGLPDMSIKVPGISSCHDFYIQLLNQFQAVSYGDQLFAMFVCLPLAMTQPSQFRKSLWMERQEVVRAITLKNGHFQEKILNAFLEPVETELELVVAYYQCLTLGYARKQVQSLLYSFAVHHIKHFIRLSTNDPERLKFIQYVKNSAKGDLKCDLEV